jgi:ATP-dependent RNA helicase MSS116
VRLTVALSRSTKLARPSPYASSSVVSRLYHASPTRGQSAVAAAAIPQEVNDDAPAAGRVITKFSELSELGLVSPKVIDAITSMGISTMTDVQTLTINQTLKGADV